MNKYSPERDGGVWINGSIPYGIDDVTGKVAHSRKEWEAMQETMRIRELQPPTFSPLSVITSIASKIRQLLPKPRLESNAEGNSRAEFIRSHSVGRERRSKQRDTTPIPPGFFENEEARSRFTPQGIKLIEKVLPAVGIDLHISTDGVRRRQ